MENIRIEKIYPHPDNPRKNLGDLTELTDSIRAYGILQNLTVVPHEEHKGAFTVVCGHRRLEAAKAAGVEELPCQIMPSMDRKTQLSTMLLENMQRSDLTPQEEAQGFQMMLELGGSVAEIVKQTGLSETKVRHRIKLNELDQKLLTEKMKGEISINDLIKLERIKDPKRRNEVLEKIGTSNFDWAVENAITEERKEYVLGILKELLPDAEIVQGWSPYPEVCKLEYRTCDDKEIEFFAEELKGKAEEEGVPAILSIGYEWTGKLKKEARTSGSERAEPDPEEKARRKRISKLEEMRETMKERVRAFIKQIPETSAMRQADKTLPYTAEYLVTGYCRNSKVEMLQRLGIENEEGEDITYHVECLEEPYRVILIATVEEMLPSSWGRWWDTDGRYVSSDSVIKKMTDLYTMISRVGYEVSEDEAGFIAGDSDLYFKEE